MKNKLPENLKLELIDNEINNIDDILLAISEENNYEMLKEYYNFLISNRDVQIYKGINSITFALQSRINVLEANIKANEELNKAKKINQSLDKISLIEEKKEDNDVNKDMHYLKFIQDDGSLTILEISNAEKFVHLLVTLAPTMNAKDFINYLKYHYFNALPTYSMAKDKVDILTYENSSIIPDKANFKVEKEILFLDYPDIIPKVSIDSNGERLYHINQSIIKFHDEDNKRIKTIISQENKEKEEKTMNNSIEKEERVKLINNENDIKISRNELDDIEVSIDEVFNPIRKFVTAKPLEKTEQIKVYAFLLNLLTNLETGFELTYTEEELLNVSIDYLQTNANNNIEKEILNRYNTFYNNVENELTENNKNVHKKTYIPAKNKNPLAFGDDGISLTIIIITVTVLLGAIIAAVLLVK